jgi:hypothetical protein
MLQVGNAPADPFDDRAKEEMANFVTYRAARCACPRLRMSELAQTRKSHDAASGFKLVERSVLPV